MARPNKGLEHVDALPGDPELKYRLKLILATISGELLQCEVYDELDLGPTQFANLRFKVLGGALAALEPRPSGRPRKVVDVTPEEVEAMRQRIVELEREVTLLRARLELSEVSLLQSPRSPKSGRKTPRAQSPPSAAAP